jgi:hypothetical protein
MLHGQNRPLLGPALRPCRALRWIGSLLMIVAAGCGGGEPKHFNWSNATGAEQHERLLWKAIRDKDWKAVEDRLAPTFIGTTPKGEALDKSVWIDHWKAAAIADFSFGEVTVQPSGADMVVTYVLTFSGAPAASQPTLPLRVVSVWQAVKQGWVLTATSATPIRP